MIYKIKGSVAAIVAKIKSLDLSKEWIVTIEPAMNHDQRKLYFKFLDEYAKHSGMHQLEIHEEFKKKFLPKFVDLILVTKSGSTTELDNKEFMSYMEQCQKQAVEDGFLWN